MDRRARARELVELALAGVEAELVAPQPCLPVDQLETCRVTLRGYRAALAEELLPPRRDRPEGLCRLVLDAWPFDLPLSNAVLQAERAFRNA